MPIIQNKGVVMCGQDLKDPATGALQQWVPPETRTALAGKAILHTMDDEGWITLTAQCEKHLLEHEKHLLNDDTPDHVRRITLQQYLDIEASHGNIPEEGNTRDRIIFRENGK